MVAIDLYFSQARVSVGQCDANYGIVFLDDGKGSFSTMDPATSGLLIRGDVRDNEVMKIKGKDYMIVSRNGDMVKAYEIRNPKSGVLVVKQ